MLSAAGGASDWVTCMPNAAERRLRDAEFVVGMRWRLGLPLVPANSRCALVRKSDNSSRSDAAGRAADDTAKRCGCSLDPYGDHFATCAIGGGPYRVHNSVVGCLRRFAKQASLVAATEQYVPELLRGIPGTAEAEEAKVDLHTWSSMPFPIESWVDVSVRHPWACRYRTRAGQQAGVAAGAADDAKATRHPGKDGVTVTPAAVEAWGRMGEAFEQLLGEWAARWAHLSDLGSHSVSGKVSQWRAELGFAMVRCFAYAYDQAVVQGPAGARGGHCWATGV